jgi:hypothetical protein
MGHGVARSLSFGVESLGQLGDFRLGQEAFDLARPGLLDAAIRIVDAQAALDCERQNCPGERNPLGGGVPATDGDAVRSALVVFSALFRSLLSFVSALLHSPPLRRRKLDS